MQGPKQMKKLKPRVPGSRKKKQAKKARKAVGPTVASHITAEGPSPWLAPPPFTTAGHPAGCTVQELGKYGTLYVEVTYHPFVSPEKQEQVQKKMEEARRKAMEVRPAT
jgi:hypothetical protein